MSLHLELSRFDGKGIAELKSIKAAREHSSELLSELVDITGDEDKNMQIGATWLLRAYLEEGARLSAGQLGRLVDALPAMSDGFARLHICQLMREVDVSPRHAEALAGFFRACWQSENTFLRAWAPDGFWRLADHHPRYETEARAMIEKSLSDARASVRARARKIFGGGIGAALRRTLFQIVLEPVNVRGGQLRLILGDHHA